MRAVYAARQDPADPLAGLVVGQLPEPKPADGWVTITVRASSLNHHDLWSLRGVGLPADRLPMILGSDAAGIAPDGVPVVVYPLVAPPPGDPRDWSLLSEYHPGTMAEQVAVPVDNLVALPPVLTFAEAACLPTAWLTAYHMLVARGRLESDSAVLIQGAGGGVATAATVLAVALGARVYVTSRDPAKLERVAELGATPVSSGGRLPERVDVVIETVGAATIEHSLKCTRPGGRIVVSGATSGHLAQIDLRRLFAFRVEILGSTMGSPADLRDLLDLCVARGVRPVVDSTHGLADASVAFDKLASGSAFGKLVLDHT